MRIAWPVRLWLMVRERNRTCTCTLLQSSLLGWSVFVRPDLLKGTCSLQDCDVVGWCKWTPVVATAVQICVPPANSAVDLHYSMGIHPVEHFRRLWVCHRSPSGLLCTGDVIPVTLDTASEKHWNYSSGNIFSVQVSQYVLCSKMLFSFLLSVFCLYVYQHWL